MSKFMVTEELIKSMIKDVSYARIGETTTMCHIVLNNGFSVTGDSACVDPAIFDAKKGEQYAYDKAFNQIWPFAGFLMKQRMFEAEQQVERIAKACHEVNKFFCEFIGDHSQKTWEESSQEVRDSARTGVQAGLEQELGPEERHNLWMRYKIANGWSLGALKDEVAKTHPCIKPYEMLPKEQKAKDALFETVIRVMKD